MTVVLHTIPYTSYPSPRPSDLQYMMGEGQWWEPLPYTPTLEGLQEAAKSMAFPPSVREVVWHALHRQYLRLGLDIKKLEPLKEDHTLTVATAHQPILFGGPLFVLAKIAATIHLARHLGQVLHRSIIPVYVMGSEDHDHEEVFSLQVGGQHMRFPVDKPHTPVGRVPTTGMAAFLHHLLTELGVSTQTPYTAHLLEALHRFDTYGPAFQYFIARIFEETELVVVDPDDGALKRLFIDVFERELATHASRSHIERMRQKWMQLGIEIRQIRSPYLPVFYMGAGVRERIERHVDTWKTTLTHTQFNHAALVDALHRYPQHFSPGVALRPLYQQRILPNIAFVAGPSELLYWLELGELFAHYGIFYPALLRRNSIFFLKDDLYEIVCQYGLIDHFFQPYHQWQDFILTHHLGLSHPLPSVREKVEALTQLLNDFNKHHDLKMDSYVEAQTTRMRNRAEETAQKLWKALRKKHKALFTPLYEAHRTAFPKPNVWQERYTSSIECSLHTQEPWWLDLAEVLHPLERTFYLLRMP